MCGFVGVTGVDAASAVTFVAMQSLQHRGQDAAGLGTYDDGRFHVHKDLGMVVHAIPASKIPEMTGRSCVGHVRYPTAGGNTREDAQPFVTRRPGILMAHNGNLTNVPELTRQLRRRGMHVLSDCDVEIILMVLADELTRIAPSNHSEADLVEALQRLMSRIRGAYTVVCVMEVDGLETMVAFRDPHGIRPGVYGTREDGAWMVSSESVALDATGFTRTGFLPAGCVGLYRKGEPALVLQVAPKEPRHCIFEHIYFARPDSLLEHGRVNSVRAKLGERLAKEWKARGLQADVVIPIPDTSRPAAIAMSEYLKLPYREGFIKNRYSGRTFIMPDQGARDAALRLKLNPIEDAFRGKRVLLVDDSVVRGATMRRIIKTLELFGAAEIHLAIFSPPVRFPCFYGIDMPTHSELVASGLDDGALETRLIDHFRCDSVTYLSNSGLAEFGEGKMCSACFDGDYVVNVSDGEKDAIRVDRRG
ncbi:MAG: amidophosphoribosyltransferase [Kiritimatiellia bacterium]|jgi:amidophosphoribosyltransferase